MPNFIRGSSGHIYSQGKLSKERDEDDISKYTSEVQSNSSTTKKPSAVNRRGIKEQQKTSLDLFKEELRRLNEERDEQRNKLKNSISGGITAQHNDESRQPEQPSLQLQKTQTPICIPLKPDPRCPTTLTLQVNINKDRDAPASGSFDTGDPTTTNLYLGNLNPTVSENDLCDIFGKFGPLASIKVMWPRSNEERARNRNSGFVAYMSRIDAERALRTLNGMDIRGYDVKLGWGKAVPLPQNPVFVPPDLVKLLEPPPYTGLPFNAQLHQDDIRRNYKVPNPLPTRLPPEIESQVDMNPEIKAHKDAYDDFIRVFQRSTVRVAIPHDHQLLDRIHRTIEYVIREGPVSEAIIISRESNNPDYRFLYDDRSNEHVYYRWKLYSILRGDELYRWRTEEFKMFEGGPIWKPPPLNPFADGMPVELIEKSTGVSKELLLNDGPVIHSKKQTGLDIQSTVRLHLNLGDTRQKGSLGAIKRPQFETMLRNLEPTKSSVGTTMMFCINHSDAAQEVIDCICEANKQLGTPLARKVALIFLVSDVLHNSSAAVTNASFYRKGFQLKLISIFENLREYSITLSDGPREPSDDRTKPNPIAKQKSENFKQKILSVLGAWREWTLYEDEFIIQLSNILLGISEFTSQQSTNRAAVNFERPTTAAAADKSFILKKPSFNSEENLDGEPLDEEILIKSLEEKGLSLRWYKTLDLSDDEEDELSGANSSEDRTPSSSDRTRSEDRERPASSIKFKASKWETVDPNEVAEQVVRLSKWEVIEDSERSEAGARSASSSTQFDNKSSPSVGPADDNVSSPVDRAQNEQSLKRFKSDQINKLGSPGTTSLQSN